MVTLGQAAIGPSTFTSPCIITYKLNKLYTQTKSKFKFFFEYKNSENMKQVMKKACELLEIKYDYLKNLNKLRVRELRKINQV